MPETLTNPEIRDIIRASRLAVNKPDRLYRCRSCNTTFDYPEFFYSQSRLRMATCPNCGKPLKA